MIIIKLTLLGEGFEDGGSAYIQEARVGEAEEEELTLQAYQCAEQHCISTIQSNVY